MPKKNRLIWKIILFLSAFFVLYQLSSYYNIYLMENEEKTDIESWKESQIQKEIHIKKGYIYYYKYSYYNLLSDLLQNFVKIHPALTSNGLQNENPSQNENCLQTETTNTTIKNPLKSQKNNDADCILSIPDINLEKIVYTGKDQEAHLKNYELVTADPYMYYKNGGNYIICGHASKLYGHSLNRIKELKKGTEIQIKTETRTDLYIVKAVNYENMYQTSKYCNQTKEKSITIISCAKNISKESYIVIHAVQKK